MRRPVPIHWTPLSRERARTVIECSLRVVRDSNATLDIVTTEEITGQSQLAYLVDQGVFDTPEGSELLRDRPHLADQDPEALRALPEGSLGREWIRFLDDNRLSLRLTKQPTPYTNDDTRAYALHRIRQSHDLWHTLIGVGAKGHEEILVHAFSLAQTGLPVSVAIVAVGSIKHMVLEKRWSTLRHDVLGAYRRGVRAAPLLGVYWERYLDQPLGAVRARFGIEPFVA
jgi:ubiquinone biosynthesis protein COQ4